MNDEYKIKKPMGWVLAGGVSLLTVPITAGAALVAAIRGDPSPVTKGFACAVRCIEAAGRFGDRNNDKLIIRSLGIAANLLLRCIFGVSSLFHKDVD
jgi:hypothetical protein